MGIDQKALTAALQEYCRHSTHGMANEAALAMAIQEYEAAKANSVMGDSPEVEARVAPGAEGSIPSSPNHQPDELSDEKAIETIHREFCKSQGVDSDYTTYDVSHNAWLALKPLLKRESGTQEISDALSFAIDWIKGLPDYGNQYLARDKAHALEALKPVIIQIEGRKHDSQSA